MRNNMIKDYDSFLNENLLKGKSEKSVIDTFKGKEYDEICDIISDMNGSPIETQNEYKSINYDDAFFIEIAWEDMMGSITLDSYDICHLNAEDIINSLHNELKHYLKNYFYDSTEEYNEEYERMRNVVERIDDTTLVNNISDFVVDEEYYLNIYYKKNGVVTTLTDDDKILDCLK